MKVLLVNTNDTGGAAKACIRLHLGLLAKNVDSTLLVKQKSDYSIPRSHYFPQPPKMPTIEEIIVNKATTFLKHSSILPYTSEEIEKEAQQRFLKERPAGLEAFSFPYSATDITENPHYKDADIVHLHWVAGFLDYPTFFKRNTKPLLWTLHDMSAFTGGEHYAERFLGMNKDGEPMPRSYSQAELQASEKYLAVKKIAMQNLTSIPIVTPTEWLKKESQKSALFQNYPHHVIPYGLPTEVFKPLDKKFCREVLSIPADKKVLLFVSADVTNHRKGYAYLKRALTELNNSSQSDYFLCAIGRESNLGTNQNLLELGGIKDERLMAMAYSAADVFILPSLEDNLPNTMLESLLCGTPVIGFPVGGICEALRTGSNGFICDEVSVEGLKKAIINFFDQQSSFNQIEIAASAAKLYSLSNQAEKYVKLYEELCKN